MFEYVQGLLATSFHSVCTQYKCMRLYFSTCVLCTAPLRWVPKHNQLHTQAHTQTCNTHMYWQYIKHWNVLDPRHTLYAHTHLHIAPARTKHTKQDTNANTHTQTNKHALPVQVHAWPPRPCPQPSTLHARCAPPPHSRSR